MSPSRNKQKYEKRTQGTRPPAPSVQDDTASVHEEHEQVLTDEEAQAYLRYHQMNQHELAEIFDGSPQESQFDREEPLQNDRHRGQPALGGEPQQHGASQLDPSAPIQLRYSARVAPMPQTTVHRETASSVPFATRQPYQNAGHQTPPTQRRYGMARHELPNHWDRSVRYGRNQYGGSWRPELLADGYGSIPDGHRFTLPSSHRTYDDDARTGTRLLRELMERKLASMDRPQPTELLDMFADTLDAIAGMKKELDKLERKLKEQIGFPANTALVFLRSKDRESRLETW